MTLLNSFSRIAAVSCLSALLTVNVAFAQPAGKPYEPSVGQEGKDVIWDARHGQCHGQGQSGRSRLR
jgi:hypothetical protein